MRILCLGDSIMQYNDYSTFPQTGWVQEFSRFFPSDTQWLDFARNGRSTKSFIDEGRFCVVMEEAQEGDFALIQFGHNDEKISDPSRYASAEKGGAYRKNLAYLVRTLRERGVLPILLSPMCRRMIENGKIVDSHKEYALAMKETAAEENVPFIDMNALTIGLLESVGEKKSVDFYMNFPPNTYSNYPEGKQDNSHLRPEGAFEFSKIAANEIKKISGSFPEYKLISDTVLNGTEGQFILKAMRLENDKEIDDEFMAFKK